MTYLYSFLFVGFVSLIGQIILDNTKLTAGHITSLFVVIGAFLDIFNIYDKIILYVGAGAMVPITSFGHSLIHGALNSAKEYGLVGLLLGMFDLTAAGITSAIVFVLDIVFDLMNNYGINRIKASVQKEVVNTIETNEISGEAAEIVENAIATE